MRFIALIFLCLAFGLSAAGQDWPDKINGYKLHKADVLVTNSSLTAADNRGDASVSVDLPKVVDIGLGGISFEIMAEFVSRKESGKIEFVTFKDVRVNGLSLDVEDYRHSFEFKKENPVTIPMPAKVSVKTLSIPRAAVNELVNSPNELAVTGTAFVFGKFKKFGFTFKRVIPVKIDLKFKNPLRS